MSRSVDGLVRRLESLSRPGLLDEAINTAEDLVNSSGMMEKIVEQRFANGSERAYGEGKWASLANGDESNLTRSGWLKSSAMWSVSGTYSVSKQIIWDQNVTNYARYVQEGTKMMPARPFLLDPDDRELEEADEMAMDAIARILMRE